MVPEAKQLTVFFTLAYLISWVIWLPLYLPVFGIHGLPILPLHHALGGLGPACAALIVTRLYGKKTGVRTLLKVMITAYPRRFIFIALVGPFLLALLAAAIIYSIQGGQFTVVAQLGSNREFPSLGILGLFLYNLLFFGFGEEVGWRGFALPRMQTRYNALTSSVLLTLFWAVWHWPLFLYRPGYTSMDIAGIVGWMLSLVTGSVLLTWFFNSTRGSILVCAVFHATVDIAFTANFSNPLMMPIMGMLITFWGLFTIFVFRPGNLSGNARVTAL